MKTQLTFKRDPFSGKYRFYKEQRKIGELRNINILDSKFYGSLEGNNYMFHTRGFFQKNTDIWDPDNGQQIGSITYNIWGTRATLQVSGRTYQWRSANPFYTRWYIQEADYRWNTVHKGPSGGRIAYEPENEWMVLTGFFVAEYFTQWLVITFLPVVLLAVIFIT